MRYLPGWHLRRGGLGGFGWRGACCPRHLARDYWACYPSRVPTKEEEKQFLEFLKKDLEEELQEINKRLEEVK
ncbi:DUF5320 domain-containing protein [Pseudothermotoga sp. U03pept]|uniref:DUF5320 domain-containing protein n=1 Tax=Pseudothermotoga sp. U03pept TaxID=3447012 RepID=UPI003F113B71